MHLSSTFFIWEKFKYFLAAPSSVLHLPQHSQCGISSFIHRPSTHFIGLWVPVWANRTPVSIFHTLCWSQSVGVEVAKRVNTSAGEYRRHSCHPIYRYGLSTTLYTGIIKPAEVPRHQGEKVHRAICHHATSVCGMYVEVHFYGETRHIKWYYFVRTMIDMTIIDIRGSLGMEYNHCSIG